MASPNPLAPDPEMVATGRRFLWTAMAFVIATTVVTSLMYLYRFGPGQLGRNAVTLTVLLLLGYFLMKGSEWARWILLVVLVVSALVLIPVLVRPDAWSLEELPLTILALSMGTGFLVISGALIFSKSVRIFFRACRYHPAAFIDDHDPSPPTWHVSANR